MNRPYRLRSNGFRMPPRNNTRYQTQENLMSQLPDQWRRYVWLAVSAAIAGLSYWIFFNGAGAVHSDHRVRPITHRDIRPSVSATGAVFSIIHTVHRK